MSSIATDMSPSMANDSVLLHMLSRIQSTLQTLQQDYRQLSVTVEAINGKVNVLSGVKQVQDAAKEADSDITELEISKSDKLSASQSTKGFQPDSGLIVTDKLQHIRENTSTSDLPNRSSGTSRIILTTYPGQSGIDPVIMQWGHKDPMLRGPVVVSRTQSTIRRRNGKLLGTSSFSKADGLKQSALMEAPIQYIMLLRLLVKILMSIISLISPIQNLPQI